MLYRVVLRTVDHLIRILSQPYQPPSLRLLRATLRVRRAKLVNRPLDYFLRIPQNVGQ